MSGDKELFALIDLIYEAVLDSDLWPTAVTRLADTLGAAQIAMLSADRRANIATAIAPRLDPDLLDQFSALVCISNAPGKDSLTEEQLRRCESIARHLSRALRISRQLWKLELKHLTPTEGFDTLSRCVLLVDASDRVVLANAAAKAALDARDGILLCDGRLAAAGSPDALQKLVASCARRSLEIGGPGGELNVARDRFRVTVAPLRFNTRLPDLPWIGLGSPVAIVTVTDRDLDWRRRQMNLRRRFDLTSMEAAFAAEILRGDGRKAAALRCGISEATAKTHLSNIFEKTGTHRQAELVRLLLGASDAWTIET